jgi:hypothetical protein
MSLIRHSELQNSCLPVQKRSMKMVPDVVGSNLKISENISLVTIVQLWVKIIGRMGLI